MRTPSMQKGPGHAYKRNFNRPAKGTYKIRMGRPAKSRSKSARG